jgi:hypothetical protein
MALMGDIEIGRRLIEEEKLQRLRQCLSEQNQLPLSVGQTQLVERLAKLIIP